MEIIINGELEETKECTVSQLVAAKGLAPESLVVELNRHIIRHDQWTSTRLMDNDRLELLSFVGGG